MARVKREESFGEQFLESVIPVFSTIFKISLVACVVSLAYLFYALLIVKVSNPTQSRITDLDAIVRNLKMVGLVCTVSTCVFALSLTIAFFHNKDMIVYMGALGAAFHFGIPLLVGRLIVAQNGSQNAATDAIMSSLQIAGKFVLVVAVLRAVLAGIDWIREGPKLKSPTVGVAEKEKASVVKQRKMNAFSPCWQLPYCRDSIKEKCPAYIAKKRCWKFGRGCYCDEQMIQAIVRGMDGGSEGSYARAATTGVQRPTKKQAKPPCGKCYIYLEHQNLKHKLLSNFMVPAAVIICVALYKPYTAVYDVTLQQGRQLWQRMAFSSHMQRQETTQPKSEWRGGDHVSTGDEIIEKRNLEVQAKFDRWTKVFILAMLATFVLVYLSKALEFVIFRLHW